LWAGIWSAGIHQSSLRRSLLELGLEVLPTDVNFLLIRVRDSARAKEELWARHILVRDCASFGLPAYIRVGTRLEATFRWAD
jgi:histidinol-phosphate/aromatic aminotransferase/cobyric acid decarboxylase-like protein